MPGRSQGGADVAEDARHAFVAQVGQPMIDLGTLGGLNSYGAEINDVGQVTGAADTGDCCGGSPHAFVVSPGQPMVDLGTLGGDESAGVAINDSGQVTGWATTADGHRHAFLATPISLLLSRLADDVTGVGPGKSLTQKIRSALAYHEADDRQATCSMLRGFIEQVNAQQGKKLGVALARQLVNDARAIRRAIRCGSG
jgi:probable HAF family extracellular repeat protein